MLECLSISYESEGAAYMLQVPADYLGKDYGNTSFNLAASFAEVIRKSGVYAKTAIQKMKTFFRE